LNSAGPRVGRNRPALLLAVAGLWLGAVAEAAPLVEAEPSRVVLGAGVPVRITVRGAGGALHGVASAGTLIAAPGTPGTVQFLWTPPPPRAPFVAVFAFWESGPLSLGSVTTLTLPCSARTELAIDTEPGARVTVEIAGAHFGPRRADGRGKLRMPVEVPPLAHEARITAEVGEQGKVRVIPLAVAASPWLWVIQPSPVDTAALAQAMLVAPEEISPDFVVTSSSAQLDRQSAESNRVLYRILPEAGTSHLTLEAALPGEGAARAATRAEVLAPPAPLSAIPPVTAPVPQGRELEIGAALGVFYAGGSNVGPAFAATLSVAPWHFPLFLELELGVRAAWFSDPVGGLGNASSTLVVFPIDLAVRGTVWSGGPWALDLRTGGGLLLGTNWVSTDFGQGSSTAMTGYEVFGAVQVSYRAGAFLPYAELRGAYALVTGAGVTANPGGLVFLLGFHWLRGLH
jgi:hypothetical protein